MSILGFISSVIGEVIWAVFATVALIVLRKPLVRLLERVRRYQGLGQDIQFSKDLDKVQRNATVAIGQVEIARKEHMVLSEARNPELPSRSQSRILDVTSSGGSKEAVRIDVEDSERDASYEYSVGKLRRAKALAETAPILCIVSAWNEVVNEMRRLGAFALEKGPNLLGPKGITAESMVEFDVLKEFLASNNYIPWRIVGTMTDLEKLKDEVQDGIATPSQADATSYVETASYFLTFLNLARTKFDQLFSRS